MINKIDVARPFVGEEEAAVVREVLLSGQYTSGKRVRAFEEAFARWNGSQYAVAVSTGTAALHIALEGLGVGPGDEVIVPPLTFFATVSSVLYLRAVPVFADIDPDDLCLYPASVAEKITPRTRAVLPVHLFGAPARMDELLALAEKHGLLVLEDCAQAHGTEFGGRKVGSLGQAGAFSFFATKHMTTGEGGMITTDDPNLADLARRLRSHGMAGRDSHEHLAYNNRMTEMGGAMGLIQLAKLDELNDRRIAHSEYILDRIQDLEWARLPRPRHACKHTYFWCPVIVRPESGRSAEQLKAHLQAQGIGFRHRYAEPLYRQPVIRKLHPEAAEQHLPVVESVAGRVIGLPNHPGLGREELDRVVEAVRSF
ncbi:MAG TPA: DegT/DnrJ/EryC1/StrS family aminotransferase [Desulfonatronum sp.]|nr:DegT/DnrJ/EryC1/StrS family aminotransferase [Desulfonatronum sp.]